MLPVQRVWLQPNNFWQIASPVTNVLTRIQNTLAETRYFDYNGKAWPNSSEGLDQQFDQLLLISARISEACSTPSILDGVDWQAHERVLTERDRVRFPRELADAFEKVNKFFAAEIHWELLCDDVELHVPDFYKFAKELHKFSWITLHVPKSAEAIRNLAGLSQIRNLSFIPDEDIPKIKFGFPDGFRPFHGYSQESCDRMWRT